MRRVSIIIALAASLACGSGTSIQGQAGELKFDMSKATLIDTRLTDGSSATFLVLSTNDNMCEILSNRTALQYSEAIFVQLAVGLDGQSYAMPNEGGTFAISPSVYLSAGEKFAFASAFGDGACLVPSSVVNAVSGEVLLSQVELDSNGLPQRLTGTIDASFEVGTVTGNFDAKLCDPRLETGFGFNFFYCN